eukprot:158271_1
MAAICNEEIKSITLGLEYVNKVLFPFDDGFCKMHEITEPTEEYTNKISTLEEALQKLNDNTDICNKLDKIERQLRAENRNMSSDAQSNPLMYLSSNHVKFLIETNTLFSKYQMVLIENTQELKNALFNGVLYEDLDTSLCLLHKQLKDNSFTDSFICQTIDHYFMMQLHYINPQKYFFVNCDNLNPAVDVILDEQARPFRLLFNLITKYDKISRLRLCALQILKNIHDRIQQVTFGSSEFDKIIANIFKEIINYQRFPSAYDGCVDNDLVQQIMEDLQMYFEEELRSLKVDDNEIHLTNVIRYLNALNNDACDKFHSLFLTNQTLAFKNQMVIDDGCVDALVMLHCSTQQSNKWNSDIIQCLHYYHILLTHLSNNESWEQLKQHVTSLQRHVHGLCEKLYGDLLSLDSEANVVELTCSECLFLVSESEL